jgi:hypothetical protein
MLKCFFRNRRNELNEFFSQENDLLFCKYACFVIVAVGNQIYPREWHLFNDSSNVSLKSVFLSKENNILSQLLNRVFNMKDPMKILNYFWKSSFMETIIATLLGI